MGVVTGGGGGGGAAFNGGTIHHELVVDTGSSTEQALELQGSRTSGEDVFRIDYPHTVLNIDSDGNLVLASDDAVTLSLAGTGAAATAGLGIRDGRTNHVSTSVSSFDGITLNQTGNASAGITVNDKDGNTLFAAGVGIGGIRTSPQQSGALPTTTFASGTAKQVDIFRDRNMIVPFTGDATNNAATLLIQLSPDDATYSTLDTLSIAAALNLTGALNVPATVYVPAGWFVKLTASHGTIGTATYY